MMSENLICLPCMENIDLQRSRFRGIIQQPLDQLPTKVIAIPYSGISAEILIFEYQAETFAMSSRVHALRDDRHLLVLAPAALRP